MTGGKIILGLMIRESKISAGTVLVLATPTFMPNTILKPGTTNMILHTNEAAFTMSTSTTIQKGLPIIIIICIMFTRTRTNTNIDVSKVLASYSKSTWTGGK